MHSNFRSGLIFENFLPFISAVSRSAIAMIKRWNFSRVGYKVILHSKFSSEQTFENLYQFISAVNWSVIANISRKIFSKVSLLLN